MKGANYGIDAPLVVRRFVVVGVVALALAMVLRSVPRLAAPEFVRWALVAAGWPLACALIMLLGSKVGKLRLRDALLSRLPWRGNERVLDVGCGRGLLLVGAAKRLSSGTVIGVDLWRSVDQADNRPEATLENARIEGVASRVEVRDGDARKLPFEDGAFDVVESSLALHNIEGDQDRAGAVREVIRVVRSGGHIGIIDVWRISQYRHLLRDAGMENVRLSWPSFWFVAPSFILTASKPAEGARGKMRVTSAIAQLRTTDLAGSVRFYTTPVRGDRVPARADTGRYPWTRSTFS